MLKNIPYFEIMFWQVFCWFHLSVVEKLISVVGALIALSALNFLSCQSNTGKNNRLAFRERSVVPFTDIPCLFKSSEADTVLVSLLVLLHAVVVQAYIIFLWLGGILIVCIQGINKCINAFFKNQIIFSVSMSNWLGF